MNLTIIGSGGCVSTPRPCCHCKVCEEARRKGFPYARTGCSLFIEDEKILIDTPEDINDALNHAAIDSVKSILYSHTDPDHIMGIRVVEQLRMDWLGKSIGVEKKDPIEVIALPKVIEELSALETCKGSMVDYYENCGLIHTSGKRHVDKNRLSIDLIPVDANENVTVFVIQMSSKKVIYAPCDVKPFPLDPIFQDADVLIIGNTIVGDVLKDGFVLKAENPLCKELFVMEEIIALKQTYGIKEVIITHIEEEWGKSYDDYLELEKDYEGIKFAYDGMKIEL